jgi:hypothetical protein
VRFSLVAFSRRSGRWRPTRAICGEECDGQYSSAIDDCHSRYGDDPADADDLANCVQEARDDYRSCLDDCAGAQLFRCRPSGGRRGCPRRSSPINLPWSGAPLRAILRARRRLAPNHLREDARGSDCTSCAPACAASFQPQCLFPPARTARNPKGGVYDRLKRGPMPPRGGSGRG